MEKDMAILMADLAGYTALTDVHGGASAARVVSRYVELVNHSLYGNSRLVQRVGDQVVVVADDAGELARTAQCLISAALQERHFLSIHAGLHYGPVHEEEGSLFGTTINVASRVMNIAQSGQVLCSSSFVGAVSEQHGCKFAGVGKFKFKNVFKEVEVFELICRDDPASGIHVDPVCHMLVDPAKEVHIHQVDGNVWYFCSSQCLELFKADPEGFVR